MKSRDFLTLLAIPLVLALGCQPAEEGEEMEAESSMMETSALSLMALNESGVTGTANLSHTEETMTVNLELSGLTAGETYAAHIHRGSCETQGPVAAALGSVTASDDGTGTIEASVSMSELGAMEGQGEGMMEEGQGMMEEGEGMMEEGEGMMEEGEGMMEEGEGMMEEGEGMEEGMEQGMEEGMSAQHTGFYIQAHLPDGTPAACANIEGPESSMM